MIDREALRAATTGGAIVGVVAVRSELGVC